jgi:hypothetical protein
MIFGVSCIEDQHPDLDPAAKLCEFGTIRQRRKNATPLYKPVNDELLALELVTKGKRVGSMIA